MVPTLQASTSGVIYSLFIATGEDNVMITVASTGADDLALFAQNIPVIYYFVGGKRYDTELKDVAPHHTPDIIVNYLRIISGIKALSQLTIDYNVSSR